MNPYYLTVLLAVVDVISLIFIIRKLAKSNKKHKGLLIAVVTVVFIVVDVLFSWWYISGNMYYDKNGKSYADEQNVVYYNKENVEYTVKEGKPLGTYYFISADGTHTMLAERVYVSAKDGCIVMDSNQSFKPGDKQAIYVDENGNEYYRYNDIKWSRSGEIRIINKD